MYEFVVKEEDFSLKRIEKVPNPNEGECFLLYQKGARGEESMIISHGVKYSATAVRHNHYNRKVTFLLQRKYFTQNYHVNMINVDFYFNADINIAYELQDVQKYFWGNLMEDDTLRHITKKCVNRQNGRWQAKQEWELGRDLEDDIERELKQFDGVKFRVTVEIRMDESAQKMQKSDKDAAVEIHTSNNRKNVQIAANKHMSEIIESERMMKMQQIQEIGMLINNFGVLGSVAKEYLEGKIDGKEFFNYIMKTKTDELNLLNMAVSNDLLTGDEAMRKINDILTNSQFEKIAGQQLPGENRDRLKAPDDEGEDAEEDVYADGDFLC